jgi:hypothetical protein
VLVWLVVLVGLVVLVVLVYCLLLVLLWLLCVLLLLLLFVLCVGVGCYLLLFVDVRPFALFHKYSGEQPVDTHNVRKPTLGNL